MNDDPRRSAPRDDPRRRGPRGIARHGRLPRRRLWGTLVGAVATAAAVVLVSGTGIAAIAGAQLSAAPHTVALSEHDQAAAQSADITAIKGGANILLLGSDTRIGQFDANENVPGARNDVTILVHVSEDHSQLTAVTFPRDLKIPIPACTDPTTGRTSPAESVGLLNTTLGKGGIPCVVDTVEHLTGLTIPYAGLITFDGVIAMSNAVGGVDVCVARPINDDYIGLHLSAGTHTLQGSQALQFLRSRHGVGDASDLARISSQQVFLSALLRKVTANGTLSNPVTLYRLAGAALRNMTLSDGLHQTRTIVGLASMLRSIHTTNELFVQYPVRDDPTDTAHVLVEQASAQALDTALQQDQKTSLNASQTGRAATQQPGAQSAAAPASGTGTAGSGPAAPSAPAADSSAASGAAGAPAATPSASATPLPSSISGQSAADQTCSVGS